MKLEPSQTAAENARTLLPKMARRYFEAGRKAIDNKTPPEKLHAFRLETKRFRYSLELFRPVYGPALERYLNQLRELQGALGKVSDCQAIQRVLAGDRKLKSEMEHALQGKLKSLRQSWRAFDSEGQLKRWRTYLSREPSSPRARRHAKTPARKMRSPPRASGRKSA